MSAASVRMPRKWIRNGLCAIPALVGCIDSALSGSGLRALLADVTLGLGAVMLGITIWEQYHPRPKRRRSRDREAEEVQAT